MFPPYVKPAIGGLLVGAIAIYYPQVLGLGYGWVQLILSGNMLLLPLGVLIILFFAKILATSLTIGSGGAGGTFAPGIVTGAFMGTALGIIAHPLFPYVSVAEVAVVTMLSFFAAASKTPVSMLIMGTEMVGGLDMFVPLTVGITIAFFICGNRHVIYDAQVLDRLHSPAHMLDYRDDIMEGMNVAELMNRSHLELDPATKAEDAFYALRARKLKGAALSSDGKVCGYITMELLRSSAGRGKTVGELSKGHPPLVDERTSIKDVLKVLPYDPEIAVVVTDPDGSIEGTVGFNEIADAYEKRFREFKIMEMRNGTKPA